MAKATKKVATQKEVVKPTFNPEKRYRWTPEDSFSLTGVEFAIILNDVLQKKEKLLQDLKIVEILEAKLRAAVESGVATELVDEAK